MLTTSTHDTKRGEDVRARLNILSEIPEEWGWELSKWELLNASNRIVIEDEPYPDRNDEYLFYQSLLGIWPTKEEPIEEIIKRLSKYMIKAVREAKIHTSWINENGAYETAITDFIEKTLSGPESESFLSTFLPFQRRIARLGMVNSLSQVVLKMTSPGVPDFYQGTELWDLNLVDPDNRRPVDYEYRLELLKDMSQILNRPTPPAERLTKIAEMLEYWEDGRIKFFITARGLRLRRRKPDLFLKGDYLPLRAESNIDKNIIAFSRSYKDDLIIAIVPRLITQVVNDDHPLPVGAESWKTTRLLIPQELGERKYFNLFTGEQVRPIIHGGQKGIFIAEALRTCPVCILVAEAGAELSEK
jgi:(1->4)-alpha-D-glucan 1-alpha-D-glucosylmutase